MLQLQLTRPYRSRVEVPDTSRSFLRLGVSSPRRNQTSRAWPRIAPGPFFYLKSLKRHAIIAFTSVAGREIGKAKDARIV